MFSVQYRLRHEGKSRQCVARVVTRPRGAHAALPVLAPQVVVLQSTLLQLAELGAKSPLETGRRREAALLYGGKFVENSADKQTSLAMVFSCKSTTCRDPETRTQLLMSPLL